jgi:hypothetical protein
VPTRGIHGLTCISNSVPNAGLLLDPSNNSIEDVNIVGFTDGILVGQNAAAQSDVILNVSGAPPGATGIAGNLIHISNATAGNVADLSILSVANSKIANTIKDDVTNTTLSFSTNPQVGMYVLGDPVLAAGSAIGYSRFSTSPRIPTWAVEKTTISTTPPGPCATGSILSNPGASGSANTLWACTGGTWANIH